MREDDFIALGDLNADGHYFDEEDLGCPLRSMHYTWLIGNGEDTNLAASDCTYERIIVTVGVIIEGRRYAYRFSWI